MRWIDVKLACRMMFRYPVLTLVACVAIGVGIPCALVPLQMAHALNRPLPFDDGERIVGFDYSMVPGQAERNPGLLDLDRWRSSLTTVHELGGAVIRTESVRGDDGLTEIVRGAEVTASFVSLTRMKPIHGRLLRPEDEAPGEPAVAVIAFDAWQTFFKGAPDAIGKTLRFGRTYRTVVGVMPEGFLYPYREHFWVPLQARADAESVQGRRVIVLGRLAPGVSEAQAQTELAAVDRPDGAEDVRTSEQPRVRLTGAAQAITDLHPPRTATGSSLLYFFGLLLVGVTCGNVATLTLARGAARSTEIAVRRALGAGRGRIVMQQFVEALLLALVAALLGLGLLALAANRVELLLQRMPYWFDVSVQPFTLAAAAGFALFSAFVAGVLPALKLTRTEAYLTLQRQAAGATVRFGLAATVLIVVEVGIAVGGLSGVASVARGAFVNPSLGDGLVPERFLTAELGGGRIQSEVARRLREEGEVQAVSFAGRLPGMDHPRGAVDIESLDGATGPVQREAMRWTAIDRDFFDTLEQPMLAGRGFEQRDLAATPRPVVVNRSFVTQAFGASNPLGRRIRATVAPGQPSAPWRESVGEVNDLGMNVTDPSKAAGL
jgi:predicted permease